MFTINLEDGREAPSKASLYKILDFDRNNLLAHFCFSELMKLFIDNQKTLE